MLVVLREYIVFQYISSYFPRCISYARMFVLCSVYWNSSEKEFLVTTGKSLARSCTKISQWTKATPIQAWRALKDTGDNWQMLQSC